MKKVTYLIGFIGWMAVASGFVADSLVRQGAGEVLGSIGVILLLFFIPLLCFDQYHIAVKRATSERLTIIMGIAGACLFGLGLLIREFHLPGAAYFIGLGIAVLTIGFPPFLFFTLYKKSVS